MHLARNGLPSAPLHCGRFAQETLPSPIPQKGVHALDRVEEITRAVKSAAYVVLFFGDSLTEHWDSTVWAQSLAPRGALNAGVSGDRTDHLLWRLMHGNLEGLPPKAVVLLIGTNDLGFGRSPELVADGIRANLETLRQHLPETSILLLGLLPREESPTAPLRAATTPAEMGGAVAIALEALHRDRQHGVFQRPACPEKGM